MSVGVLGSVVQVLVVLRVPKSCLLHSRDTPSLWGQTVTLIERTIKSSGEDMFYGKGQFD